VKITLQHFFEPLYKDYSVVGRVLGVIFRFGRVVIGAGLYAAVTLCFIAIYLVWIAVPPTLLFFSVWKT
jgi:hypothetical protein